MPALAPGDPCECCDHDCEAIGNDLRDGREQRADRHDEWRRLREIGKDRERRDKKPETKSEISRDKTPKTEGEQPNSAKWIA
jgi:hypothetical protein